MRPAGPSLATLGMGEPENGRVGVVEKVGHFSSHVCPRLPV